MRTILRFRRFGQAIRPEATSEKTRKREGLKMWAWSVSVCSLVFFSLGKEAKAQDYVLRESYNKTGSERFGQSVDVDGDYAVFGSPKKIVGNRRPGGFYIYKRDALTHTWNEDTSITWNGGNNFNDAASVAMSGNYVVIGMPGRSGYTPHTGRVNIYYGGPNNDTWGKSIPNGERFDITQLHGAFTPGDQYGHAVDIDGEHAIVSAKNRSDLRGAVYMYTRNTSAGVNTWSATGASSGSKRHDQLGQSVALDGTHAAAGAHGYDVAAFDAGGVYTYNYNGTSWVASLNVITASDAAAHDWFGYSVDISGDYMVVGANRSHNGGIADAGAVYVYHWNGNSWVEVQKLQAPDPSANAYFGYSVSIEGNQLAIGAEGAQKVYIYTLSGSSWTWNTTLSHSGSGSDFGTACDISQDGTLMVGAPTGATSSVSMFSKGPYYWTGAQSGDYHSAANWAGGQVPDPTQEHDLVIVDTAMHNLVLPQDMVAHSLTIGNGKTLDLNGHVLTVSEGFNNQGTVKGSNTGSSLRLLGACSSTSLQMDQSLPGNSNHLDSLVLRMTCQSTLTLASSLEVGRKVHLGGNTLVSNGNLTLTAASPSSYGQIDGSEGGAIAGAITVEKKLVNSNAGWRQFALPVNAVLNDLTGISTFGVEHSPAVQRNVYRWNATDAGNGIAAGWFIGNAQLDDNQHGYVIFSDNSNGVHLLSTDLSITGTYSTGTHKFKLRATEDPSNPGNPDFDGWNLIPNPFAANIDAGPNSALWAKLGNYKGVRIWNYLTSQFDVITQSGVAIQGENLSGETIIPPFQAFWVKVDTDMPLELDETLLNVNGTVVTPFMKNSTSTKEIFRLNITDANQYTDQSVIYLDPQATLAFDGAKDALKMYSMDEAAPALYFRDEAGSAVSIKALEEGLLNTLELPIGFTQKNDGGLVKVYADLTEWNPNMNAFIRDNRDGSIHALGANDTLQFLLPANAEGVLTLLFKNSTVSAEETAQEEMQIGMNGSSVFVQTQDLEGSGSYQLFDMSGREVHSGQVSMNGEVQEIDIQNLPAGMYVLHLNAGEGQVHKVLRY